MENRTDRVNQLEPVVDYLCDDLWRSKKVKTTCLGRVVVTDWEQGRDDIFPPRQHFLESSLLSFHIKTHSAGHLNLAMLIRARSHSILASSMRERDD